MRPDNKDHPTEVSMEIQELKLSAYGQFHCLAERCPKSCCQSFKNIPLDPQTLQKWQDLADPKVSKNLLANVVYDKSKSSTTLRREDGACAFLGTDKLCTIHARYGPDLLSPICRNYPRKVLETDWKRLETLALSCPEATRLILFENNKSPLFDPNGARTHNTYRQFGNASIPQRLDELVDTAMQNTKYPLNVKILTISTILAQRSTLLSQDNFNRKAHDGLFKKVGSRLYELNLAIKQGKITTPSITRGSYWKSIYQLVLMTEISLTSFDLHDSAWHKLVTKCQDIQDDFIKIDQEFAAYTNSARAALQNKYGNLFLRYLTISFTNQGFPWATLNHQQELRGFVHSITKLAAIQLICLIKQHETGNLDEECLCEVIYTVEHNLDHSSIVGLTLEKYPESLNLQRYQHCFSDFF